MNNCWHYPLVRSVARDYLVRTQIIKNITVRSVARDYLVRTQIIKNRLQSLMKQDRLKAFMASVERDFLILSNFIFKNLTLFSWFLWYCSRLGPIL
jgi:hypothetical protein